MNYYFSIFGGYIYQASEQEEKILDAFQIPLLDKPTTNCKKCFGKFHVGYNTSTRHFTICPKCSKKQIDVKKLLKKDGNK